MLACLVVGHSKYSKGAHNPNLYLTEFDYNKNVVNTIYELFEDDELEIVPVYRHDYATLPDTVNSYNPDFAIEFHCNAFNMGVRGTEVLYYESSEKGKQLAEVCQNIFLSDMDQEDRGIKPTSTDDRGGYMLTHVRCPIVICEPFFIDNDDDVFNEEFMAEVYMTILKEAKELFK